MWVCLFGRLFNTLCLCLQAEGRKLTEEQGGCVGVLGGGVIPCVCRRRGGN